MASKPDLPEVKTDEGDQFIQVPRKRRPRRRPQPTENEPETTDKAPEQKAEDKPKKVYGKPGDIYCLLCRAMRDHSASECPQNRCYNCGQKGHFAESCTTDYCRFCNMQGHVMETCNAGGSLYAAKRKRPDSIGADTALYSNAVTKKSKTNETTPSPGMNLNDMMSFFLNGVTKQKLIDKEAYNSKFKEIAEKRAELDRQEAALKQELRAAELVGTAMEYMQQALPLVEHQRPSVPDATPRSASKVLASSLAGRQAWSKRTPAASMPCAPVNAPQAPPEDLISRQVQSKKTPVVASSGRGRVQSIETLEEPHTDNKITELRCGKQDKLSSTAGGIGYPGSESASLALSDDLMNQQVLSPEVQSLEERVESAEVPETWEDLVKKEEDEPDELPSDEEMEEQPS